MTAKLAELSQRRALLLARAATQREALTYFGAQVQRPLRRLEMVVGLLRSIRFAPILVTTVTTLVLGSSRRRWARIPKLVWNLWRLRRVFRLRA